MDSFELCRGEYKHLLTLSKNETLTLDNLLDDELIEVITLLPYYSSLALNRFKWNIDKKYSGIIPNLIEKLNLFKGRCVLANINNKGFGIYDFVVTKNSTYNFLGQPEQIELLSPYNAQNINITLNSDEFVIIPNTDFWIPTIFDIFKYVRRIDMCDTAIESNLKTQRFPILLMGDEKQKMSLANLSTQIDKNFNYLFAEKSFSTDLVQRLEVNAPYLCNDIQQTKKEIENELLTFLGIQNENVNKLSGVNDYEVNANNEKITKNLNNFLLPRINACNEIKDKFNIDISVESEVDYNVNVHNEFERVD